jgi:hypothetical protein
VAQSGRDLIDTQEWRKVELTDDELRAAGQTLGQIVLRRMEGISDDEQLIERGAFAEALLALGVGDELTVRGEVARERWRRDMEERWPGSYALKMTA